MHVVIGGELSPTSPGAPSTTAHRLAHSLMLPCRRPRSLADFKEVEEESVRDNFVIIYELLDELMDFGYPQSTSALPWFLQAILACCVVVLYVVVGCPSPVKATFVVLLFFAFRMSPISVFLDMRKLFPDILQD